MILSFPYASLFTQNAHFFEDAFATICVAIRLSMKITIENVSFHIIMMVTINKLLHTHLKKNLNKMNVFLNTSSPLQLLHTFLGLNWIIIELNSNKLYIIQKKKF